MEEPKELHLVFVLNKKATKDGKNKWQGCFIVHTNGGSFRGSIIEKVDNTFILSSSSSETMVMEQHFIFIGEIIAISIVTPIDEKELEDHGGFQFSFGQ